MQVYIPEDQATPCPLRKFRSSGMAHLGFMIIPLKILLLLYLSILSYIRSATLHSYSAVNLLKVKNAELNIDS